MSSTRNDVEAKLSSVDEWVRAEFGFVSDLMAAVGCESRDESGPGRSFSLGGRRVLRVHPKRHHLALGFPDSLRLDVDALTHALRGQQGAAWLNYHPGLYDRDTIEILVDKGVGAIDRCWVSSPVRRVSRCRPGPAVSEAARRGPCRPLIVNEINAATERLLTLADSSGALGSADECDAGEDEDGADGQGPACRFAEDGDPESERDGTGSWDHTVRVWDLRPAPRSVTRSPARPAL